MKARLILSAALVLLMSTSAHAQKVRGIFSLSDYLTRNSYIGHAGRQYLKPVPPKPSTFQPLPFDPTAPAGNIGADGEFVLYLLDRGLRDDALTLLGEGNYAPSDSLSWLRGMALFEDRQFQVAEQWLSRVEGPLAESALFYGNVARIHLDRPFDALTAFIGYDGPNTELAALQNAGLALLTGNISLFREEEQLFTYSDYRLAESEKALKELSSVFGKRSKSPWLAAGLSALVPGAGKVYAGKTGQGVASFIAVGTLAAVTAEQWKHHGFKDWRTILAGSLCTVFYIGNIYGSWFSVGINLQEVNDETKALVLYNLTVPLGGFFR